MTFWGGRRGGGVGAGVGVVPSGGSPPPLSFPGRCEGAGKGRGLLGGFEELGCKGSVWSVQGVCKKGARRVQRNGKEGARKL